MPYLKDFSGIFDEVMKQTKADKLKKTPDNWSWAVCAATIVRYYNGGSVEASAIANKALSIIQKEIKGRDINTISIPEHPNLEQILKDYSIAAKVFPNIMNMPTGFPKIEELKTQIDRNWPVIAWIKYEKEKYSDFIIIDSYDEKNLGIQDPLDPKAKKTSLDDLQKPEPGTWAATWIDVHP